MPEGEGGYGYEKKEEYPPPGYKEEYKKPEYKKEYKKPEYKETTTTTEYTTEELIYTEPYTTGNCIKQIYFSENFLIQIN